LLAVLQINLDRFGDWAAENAMEINPGKSKVVSYTINRVEEIGRAHV
jgi:hypothetical protein